MTTVPFGHLRAGDVVAIHEDGQIWGRKEAGPDMHPEWRIFVLKELPAAALSMFYREEVGEKQEPTMVRECYFDMDDPWLREVCAKMRVIEFYAEEKPRLLATRKTRNLGRPLLVGG